MSIEDYLEYMLRQRRLFLWNKISALYEISPAIDAKIRRWITLEKEHWA